MRRTLLSAVAVTAVALATLPAIAAHAVQTAQSTLVSPVPVKTTPAVNDGAVRAIVQIGNTIYLGGTFSSVTSYGSTTAVTRNDILAFDATTGVISTTFLPTLNGPVDALVAAPDGQSIYVGGEFSSVNGVATKSLTRLNVSNGAVATGFKTVAINGNVLDLRLSNNRLFIGGNFTKVATHTQSVLATLNAATGAFDPFQSLAFSGTHHGGSTSLQKMDITPDGSKLVAIGNFTSVGGVSHDQVVMLNLTGASAALQNWTTTFYTANCASAFNSYMRDLDISPDGSYMVISTTGAYGGSASPCDSTTRWEMNATGTQTFTWLANTGGDTTYAVAITGTAVYTGGHFRWQNNSFAGDKPGAGAVARTGIAALDPANGLPLDWNPGRTRGVGVFDILATSTGLWVGSDTNQFDGFTRPRIVFVPLAGGKAVPSTATQQLPGEVYLGGAVGDSLSKVAFTGTSTSGNTTLASGGVSWSQSRGAVYINGTVYTGWSDGNLYARSFDGTTFGSAVSVAGMDTLAPLTAFHTDVKTITAMFFDSGRLYYTLSGQSTLFYRYFTPSTNVIGAVRYTGTNTTSVNLSNASAMFTSGNTLYVGDRNSGNLQAVSFSGGVLSGTPSTVSGPVKDGVSWSVRSAFVAPH
jgi:hypothetical protein